MKINYTKIIAKLFDVDSKIAEDVLSGIDSNIVIEAMELLKVNNPNDELQYNFEIVVNESFSIAIKNIVDMYNERATENLKYVNISYCDTNLDSTYAGISIDETLEGTIDEQFLKDMFNELYSDFILNIEYEDHEIYN